VQKDRGEKAKLTEVWNGLERGGVMTSTADRRWRRSGCSRTARCGAPPGLLFHQTNPCRSCEGVKRVSGAGDAPAVSNCAAACDSPEIERRNGAALGFWVAAGLGHG
jgi:hypothetical protein